MSVRTFDFELKKWKRLLHNWDEGEPNYVNNRKTLNPKLPPENYTYSQPGSHAKRANLLKASSFQIMDPEIYSDLESQTDPVFFLPHQYRGDPHVLYSGQNVVIDGDDQSIPMPNNKSNLEDRDDPFLENSRVIMDSIQLVSSNKGLGRSFAGKYACVKHKEEIACSRAIENYQKMFPQTSDQDLASFRSGGSSQTIEKKELEVHNEEECQFKGGISTGRLKTRFGKGRTRPPDLLVPL